MEHDDITRLSGCSCNPVSGSHRPPCQWAAQARYADPAEVDGPGPEWYRELAEAHGTPWPRGIHLARLRMAQMWPCPRCGGPKVCPNLDATLLYRQCGYAPVDPADVFGRWVHQ